MRIYYIKPPVIMFGVMTPVFLFLSFMVRRNLDAEALVPGLVAMTVFFAASSVSSATIPWERGQQTYERLLVAPVSLFAVLWGKALAGMLFGAELSVVPILIGTLAFGMPVREVWLLALALVVSSGAFASLGVLFASVSSSLPGNIMMLGNMVRMPLLFVSGIFIPLDSLPAWGRPFAFLSPLTYANDLVRHSVSGASYLGVPVALGLLLAFWVAFLVVGVRLHTVGQKA
jgi:ABC-2 type transport system permease protein